MNGAGYEFNAAAAAAAAYNQLESFAQSLNEQQSRGKQARHHFHHHQPVLGVPGYNPLGSPYHLPPSLNRPESQSYDPTRHSNSPGYNAASAQHQLLMAAYGQSANIDYTFTDPSTASSQQPNAFPSLFALTNSSANTIADLQALLHLQQQQQQQQQQQRQQERHALGISQQFQDQHFEGNLQSKSNATQFRSDPLLDELFLMRSNLLGPVQDSFTHQLRANADVCDPGLTQLVSSSNVISSNVTSSNITSSNVTSSNVSASNATSLPTDEVVEPWLRDFRLSVSSLSLQPLSGEALLNRLKGSMNDVLKRYIPCVDFLVHCQQELRKGLEYATTRSVTSGNKRRAPNLSPKLFFRVYVEPLSQTFYEKNSNKMDQQSLEGAFEALQKLTEDARKAERQGCEAVKSNFLGGMKDGESWGLRKWLSKHGNALSICTDLECILSACQKLDRSDIITKKLAELIRPMALSVLNKLRSDIPPSYQLRSSAHPYLPFFHRLEAALHAMSIFNPDDDDVICIDDSDGEDDIVVEEVKSTPVKVDAVNEGKISDTSQGQTTVHHDNESDAEASQGVSKRRSPPNAAKVSEHSLEDESSSGESDNESVVEIFAAAETDAFHEVDKGQDWTCTACKTVNREAYVLCQSCGEEVSLNQLPNYSDTDTTSLIQVGKDAFDDFSFADSSGDRSRKQGPSPPPPASSTAADTPVWPVLLSNKAAVTNSANAMAQNIGQLAALFEAGKDPVIRPSNIHVGEFWYGCRFAAALRLFVNLLRKPESPYFIDQVDDHSLIKAGNPPFSHVIKHPICFRDIVAALILDVEEQRTIKSSKRGGRLPDHGLSKWNMWNGIELLQAIDLVLVNSLAYGKALKQGRSAHRSNINQIRKEFWSGIINIVSSNVNNEKEKKCYLPTRRSETSGFVVYKINES